MKSKINKSDFYKSTKNIMLTILGTLILAFSSAMFIIPFDLVAGGITSISIIIEKIIASPYITVDLIITVLAWSLFLIGFFVLGKDFAFKTLISTIIYPLGVSFFSRLVNSGVFGGFFDLKASRYSNIAIIMACLFGGLLIGMGCAVTFLGGGSTGGVDVLAFIICKHFKKLRSSKVIFYIDSVVIAIGVFVIRDLIITLLGIITAFVGALVIDRIFLGSEKAFNAQIISDRYEEINSAIIEVLGRTTTLIKIRGGYSKNDKVMLTVSFKLRQYAELIGIVNQIDKSAFVTITDVHEISGNGWTR
ncbi:MAG: YitT family protein [Ruminococcaceae bacterium]|nr:YitT family protein [Oscillospiraceae bacterium]